MHAITQLLSHDTELLFLQQSRMLHRCISILFGLVGCSWFLLLLPDSLLTTECRSAFQVGQYKLYTVLLTLWGYEHRRQSVRYSTLLELSAAVGKMPFALTLHDIRHSGKLHLFEVFTKHKGSQRNYHHIIFVWLLLAAAITLFVSQCFMLLAMSY